MLPRWCASMLVLLLFVSLVVSGSPWALLIGILCRSLVPVCLVSILCGSVCWIALLDSILCDLVVLSILSLGLGLVLLPLARFVLWV